MKKKKIKIPKIKEELKEIRIDEIFIPPELKKEINHEYIDENTLKKILEEEEIKKELKEIKISSIFIPPDYRRRYIDPEWVDTIALSIWKYGQINPIIVVPINYVKDLDKRYPEAKKYEYILIDGLYRIKAMEFLGQSRIRALIKYNDYDIEDLKYFGKHCGVEE
ncbi:MAG: ParB N-terminal domain-containing protein [Candidatus Methanomethylicaceae archaeon]